MISHPMDNKIPRARILLVDDEPDITLIFEKGLQKFDFEVTSFNSPQEALSNFKVSKYDIALLDVRMPGMDGYELCKKILGMDNKVKICFMTAFEVHEPDLKKIFPSSDTYFIRKPVKIRDLVEGLEKIIV